MSLSAPAQTPASNQPYAEAALTSKHLILGEPTTLLIRTSSSSPNDQAPTFTLPDAKVQYIRTIKQLTSSRQLVQAYVYHITPSKVGHYSIPSIHLTANGTAVKTPPISLHVHPLSELTHIPTTSSPQPDAPPIYALWATQKTTLYPKELSETSLKLYFPTQLHIRSQGIPDPAKTNCLAWRFNPPTPDRTSIVQIQKHNYHALEYTTALSGITPGPATFGPAKLNIISQKRITDSRYGSIIKNIPLDISIPALHFTIRPLPPKAPADFHGAVGNFTIRATFSKTTLSANDTTSVTLQISGTGNLETLHAPELISQGWKIIDTSKVTRGKERRSTTGSITFRQLLRPLAPPTTQATSTLKAQYSLTYLSPKDNTYHTLKTTPVTLTITPLDLQKSGLTH